MKGNSSTNQPHPLSPLTHSVIDFVYSTAADISSLDSASKSKFGIRQANTQKPGIHARRRTIASAQKPGSQARKQTQTNKHTHTQPMHSGIHHRERHTSQALRQKGRHTHTKMPDTKTNRQSHRSQALTHMDWGRQPAQTIQTVPHHLKYKGREGGG